jgi:hypothetical protein
LRSPRARLGDADFVQQLQRALRRRLARQAQMQPHHLAHLVADGEHGVERGHRLLEHDRDVLAAQFAQPLDRLGQQVAAAVVDAARGIDDGVVRQQPHDSHCRHTLARAGLADQRDGGVFRHVERHAAHRLGDLVLAQAERHAQIAH